MELPVAYKRFLLSGHGGYPVQNEFSHGGSLRMVEFFLPILDDPDEEEEGWRDTSVVLTELDGRILDDEDMVGMNIIPFAALAGGDFVCFDFRKNPAGPDISVWDHERSEELAPHLEKVAPSFEAFLAMLKG